jgi:hypothetical protein
MQVFVLFRREFFKTGYGGELEQVSGISKEFVRYFGTGDRYYGCYVLY